MKFGIIMNNEKFYLSKLMIKGFKAIANNIINFRPISIIIGENGTGKTTILEGIKYATIPKIPDDFEIHCTKSKETKSMMFELHYKGKFIIEDLDLKNTAVGNNFILFCVDPKLRFTFLPNQNYICEASFFESKLFIKNKEFDSNKISKNYFEMSFSKGWHNVWSNIQEELNKQEKRLGEIVIDFLNEFFDRYYNFQNNRISSGGSSSGPVPIHYTFDLKFPLKTIEGLEVIFRINIFEKISDAVLIDSFRRINKISPEITEYMPLLPELRSTPEGIISFFHYARHPDYEASLSTIKKWASEFGLVELASIPSPNRQILLQFKDQIYNAYVDVSEGGLGVGQLIFIIVECILSQPGTILLIDEPETHLHAKYQAKIMDLIIETMSRGVQIIVATHSEYFISRLQRRIAEKKVNKQDVIIIETKRKKQKGIIIKEHFLDSYGFYMKDPPDVIKFAQNEFLQWNKNIGKRE